VSRSFDRYVDRRRVVDDVYADQLPRGRAM
jgi:hypothetical protein